MPGPGMQKPTKTRGWDGGGVRSCREKFVRMNEEARARESREQRAESREIMQC